MPSAIVETSQDVGMNAYVVGQDHDLVEERYL